MPFGLKNAPVFFQRIMDKTLRDVRAFARCYIDDIIIFSKSHAEHKVHLREVFQRLREKGIKCHPKRLRCAVKDVAYLGHLVVPNEPHLRMLRLRRSPKWWPRQMCQS
jgi:hypothetical protein